MRRESNPIRVPIVFSSRAGPVAWYNMARNRIEIRHGEKLTVIQLPWEAFPRKVQWVKRYERLHEEYIPDIDDRTVASIAYGDEQMDSDLLIIRHAKSITCLAIPRGTPFQVQHERSRWA